MWARLRSPLLIMTTTTIAPPAPDGKPDRAEGTVARVAALLDADGVDVVEPLAWSW